MSTFTPVGQLKKAHEALSLTVDGWRLGELVIGADNIAQLLIGVPVDVNFVQQRGGRVFIGYAGTARLSRSGKAVNIRLESRFMTVPRKALEAVVEGKRKSARLSAPAPIIDADREQREAIDAGLPGSF